MKKYKYVYVLGVGGIGMSAIARWFYRQGAQVFGHDITSSALTDQLIGEGIPIHFEASIASIPATILAHSQDTLVLYTPSISEKHPIWKYLVEHGYAVCKRGDILSLVTKAHYTVAIAGTHGKTTSTSLAAHILCFANKNITAFLGGIAKNYNSNFIASNNTEKEASIVIEADEFDRFFLQLYPDIAIVTTVDPDHLDIYENTQEFEKGFRQFLSKLPEQGIAILHTSVARRLIHTNLTIKACVLEYALKEAPIYATNVHINKEGYFCFDYVSKEIIIKDICLPIPGYHNIENTLAVITACLQMDVTPETIREAIHTFQGVARRFDMIIEKDGVVFLDDYAHHPVEITALLTTLRKMYPGKRITVIFRPNQYSRTKDFLLEIVQSLSLADCVFILDIYSDREAPIDGINSKTILDKMELSCKHYVANKADLIAQLSSKAGKPEIVVNLGAGDADNFVQPIKDVLLKNNF